MRSSTRSSSVFQALPGWLLGWLSKGFPSHVLQKESTTPYLHKGRVFVLLSGPKERVSKDKAKTIIHVHNPVASFDEQKTWLTPLPSTNLSTSSTQRQVIVCIGDF